MHISRLFVLNCCEILNIYTLHHKLSPLSCGLFLHRTQLQWLFSITLLWVVSFACPTLVGFTCRTAYAEQKMHAPGLSNWVVNAKLSRWVCSKLGSFVFSIEPPRVDHGERVDLISHRGRPHYKFESSLTKKLKLLGLWPNIYMSHYAFFFTADMLAQQIRCPGACWVGA